MKQKLFMLGVGVALLTIAAAQLITITEYTTKSGNGLHAIRLGLNPRGEQRSSAIITAEQARLVHCRLAEFSGYGACVAIAEELGISVNVVHNIKYGKAWTPDALDRVQG